MALANMSQAETDRKNREHCKSIALDLEAYVNGEMYRCPKCGEIFNLYEVGNYETADEAADGIEKANCPHCDHVSEFYNDFEPLSIWDYLEDALDFRFLLGSDKSVIAVKVLIAYGGPNIWIDTETGSVNLYWWTDRASYPISSDVAAALDEWAEEYFNC